MNRVVIKLQVSAKALPIIFFIVLIASIQDVGAQSSGKQSHFLAFTKILKNIFGKVP